MTSFVTFQEVEELSAEKLLAVGLFTVAVPRFRAKWQIASGSELPQPVQSFEAAPFSRRRGSARALQALSRRLRDALIEAFPSPSPIQAQAWPICHLGHDLVAVAKTGSQQLKVKAY